MGQPERTVLRRLLSHQHWASTETTGIGPWLSLERNYFSPAKVVSAWLKPGTGSGLRRHLPAVSENTHLYLVFSRLHMVGNLSPGVPPLPGPCLQPHRQQNILEFTEQVSFCSMLNLRTKFILFKDQDSRAFNPGPAHHVSAMTLRLWSRLIPWGRGEQADMSLMDSLTAI